MECLEGCEFLIFENKIFNCKYYEKELDIKVDGGSEIFFEPQRCKECIDDRLIGSNTLNENIKKVKYRLGLIADSFYSFKDDFEEELTEVYRVLKDLEVKTYEKK